MNKFLKIISILIVFILVLSLFSHTKADNEVNSYKIKQITNENEIKSDSASDYIIVCEEDNVNYALASTYKEDTSLFAMGNDNAEVVEINGDNLIYTGTDNIFWNFTKSTETVKEGKDKPAIASSASVFDGDNEVRKQLKFSVTNTQRNPAGIEYTSNGYSFNFHFDNNGYVELEQNNGIAKYSYMRFLSSDKRFLSSTPGKAAKLKIYEVIKSYKQRGSFEISNIESNPEYPNPGSTKINKEATESEKYKANGKATVKLNVIGEPIKRNTDVLLVLDDSNSVYDRLNDTEQRRVDIIKSTAVNFAEKVLNLNSNNKVGIIKFSSEIIDKEESETLGLSNDIEQIRQIIMKEKTNNEGGTNYTEAFKQANKMFEKTSTENRDSVVIFISDGAPSIYNRIKYTVYKNTSDGIVGNHADNWVNYFLNSDLKENILMKEAGTKIYTIGAENSSNAITSTGAFVVNSEDTKALLQKLSTGKSYFYDWQKIKEELPSIYEDIFKDFYTYPNNAVVTDILSDEVELLTKKVDNENEKIQIKHGEDIIEEITFNEDGTEAYSNLKETENVLTRNEDGTIKIDTQNFTYDQKTKTIVWKIGDIDTKEWSLEYPVYLTRTVNLYNEGNDRETGEYDTNKIAYIEYKNHLKETVRKEFSKPKINWNTNISQEGTKNEENTINENGEIVKTGDNIIFYVLILILLIAILVTNKVINNRKKVVKK